jgi:hypothetical protein
MTGGDSIRDRKTELSKSSKSYQAYRRRFLTDALDSLRLGRAARMAREKLEAKAANR